MPRGVRKSPLEKLQQELQDTQEAIAQYKSAIKTLEEKVKLLQDKIQIEELKEVSSILEEKNMSIAELREFLNATSVSPKDE
ncbi:hypothetical protein [Lacrimispora indolis]|uniref:hypothetical protein n=1 Tax=Lacrimispora indolis TaxID=69825 RepID=UPI000421B00E|nr:hypothetical protein [[Clostridium] methoxybenzovorans]